MRKPKVFNKYHHNAPRTAAYIGRGSPFGNPFIIGKDGTREEVCEKFKQYVQEDKNLQFLIKRTLKGKDLMCFCKPAQCHGDYLLEVANQE